MTVAPLRDTSAADWLTASTDDWQSLLSLGPSTFASHVRVFHGPASTPADEVDQLVGELPAAVALRLREVLSEHTTTPDECFFALWDGFGELQGSPATALITDDGSHVHVPPAFAPAVMDGPRVRLPYRDFLLFRGPLDQAGEWGAAPVRPGWPPRRLPPPTLMWPADRAWFVASEIDLPWTGVAGSLGLTTVLESEGFDLQRATAGGAQPFWRTAT